MEIVEVPLDAPAEEAPPPAAAPPPAEPAAAPEAKRGRGRPKGAANKPKPARREPTPEPVSPPKKRKPAAQKAPKKKVVHESSESEDARDAGKTTREIAGEVLELVSLQRANQRAQRRDRYAAWFH